MALEVSDNDLKVALGAIAKIGDATDNLPTLYAALLRHVPRLFHAEISAINFADLNRRQVTALKRSRMGAVRDTDEPLSRLIEQHPVLSHYRTTGDMTPRAMGEFLGTREWTSSPLYSEVFHPMGTPRHLVLPVARLSTGCGIGISFNRSGFDFVKAERDFATLLQSGLVALHAAASNLSKTGSRTELAVAADRFHLTSREVEIVTLLVDGLTAQSIGHMLRISPRTVRKHLEHVYAKTGCHDRLAIARMFD